jgi:argininosuccinate lyase
MKSLPLAYNKDMQEDKEPLFDTIDTVKGSLKIFADMIAQMGVKAESMRIAAARGFSTATDVADYVVRKGLPFRQAHEVVGKTVRYCIENNREIEELTLEEFRTFSDLIEADIYDYVTLEASVNARRATGGTAREAVQREIQRARQARNEQ